MVVMKLKRKHKEFLAAQMINHKEFLLLDQAADYYKFFHKKTGKSIFIRR
ncbi:DUF6906 family protein [Clostridium botulinum]